MSTSRLLEALVDDLMTEYLDSIADRLPDMAREFQDSGFIEVPNFAARVIWPHVRQEVYDLLETRGRRRDLQVAVTGNSPRSYFNVSRDDIVEHAELIPLVYRSEALFKFLQTLANEPVVPVPYAPEEIVITRMAQGGDSHGWHWDDYSYSMIWMIDSPPLEMGGDIQFVRDTEWDKADPQIEHYLSTRPVVSRHPATGSIYLLKADTAMHRVSPIRDGATRCILCFSYANLADLEREVTHETMEQIYAPVAESVA